MIVDFLSQLKNTVMAKNESFEAPYSKLAESVAQALKTCGFVASVKSFKNSGESFKRLHIEVAFGESGEPIMSHLKMISKPSLRKYIKSKDIKKIRNGMGVQIISTPRGVLTGQESRKKALGGEVICEVY